MAHPPPGYTSSPEGWPERAPGSDAPSLRESLGHPPGYPPGYPLSYPGNVEEVLTLRDLLDVAHRGRWLILGALLAVAIPVAVYTYQLPDQYQASSVLLVETDPESDLAEVLPTSAIIGTGQGRAVGNEMLVLQQSYALAEQTAERLIELGQTPEGEPLTILATAEDSSAPLSARKVSDRLQGQYLAVGLEQEDLDVLRITATSTIPEEAALIANLYAEAYLNRTRQTSRASVSASRAFLEEQVDSLATELVSREEAVRSFMSRTGAVRLDEEAGYIVEQVSALHAQRDEARISAQMKTATVTALERELAQIEPRLAARLAAGTEGEMATVQERIRELQGRLEQTYLQNPTLREAASPPAEIGDLRRQVNDLRSRASELSDRLLRDALATGGIDVSTDGIARVTELRRRIVDERIELSGLQVQADIIGGRIGGYEGDLGRIPTQSIELARLARDRQSTERLVMALGERLQEARLAEQSELGYAEVIRPAFSPSTPFAPNRPRNVIIGIVLGLMVGFGLAYVRVHLDHRIHRPDDLREHGYVVLGVLPDVSDILEEDFKGAETIESYGRTFSTMLTPLLLPLSQASEAYRALRTSVQFSRLDTMVQTIVVTSPNPGEGKSTTAANLGIVMAQAGRRVLLVDADLRRPRVHRFFSLAKRPGLVDALFQTTERERNDDNEMQHSPVFGDGDNVLATGVDNIDLLPAGMTVPYPSEVLGSRALRDRIEQWRQVYDVIIFDTPPVLAATDAVLLSTQADATLVVVEAGKTKNFELERTFEALRSVGSHVAGTVLNGFDTSHAYGYKYRYTYGYRQKYGYGYSDVQRERLRERKSAAEEKTADEHVADDAVPFAPAGSRPGPANGNAPPSGGSRNGPPT